MRQRKTPQTAADCRLHGRKQIETRRERRHITLECDTRETIRWKRLKVPDQPRRLDLVVKSDHAPSIVSSISIANLSLCGAAALGRRITPYTARAATVRLRFCRRQGQIPFENSFASGRRRTSHRQCAFYARSADGFRHFAMKPHAVSIPSHYQSRTPGLCATGSSGIDRTDSLPWLGCSGHPKTARSHNNRFWTRGRSARSVSS